MQQSSSPSCFLLPWAPCWLQVSLSVLDPKLLLFLQGKRECDISGNFGYVSNLLCFVIFYLPSAIHALTISASGYYLRCTISNPQAANTIDTVQYLLVGLYRVHWHFRHLQIPENKMSQIFFFKNNNLKLLFGLCLPQEGVESVAKIPYI